MKKNIILCFIAIISSTFSFAQVGIHTTTPKATLDVQSKPSDTTIPDGFIAPRLKGYELKAKDALYTKTTASVDGQTGTMVYITEGLTNEADRTAKTINVNEPGYYFFNGEVWVKVKSSSDEVATVFLGGSVYSKFNQQSGGAITNERVIGGNTGVSYPVGLLNATSSKGGIMQLRGNGYTVSNPEDGIFDIKFNTPFTEIYGVSLNIVDAYYGGSLLVPNGKNPNLAIPGDRLDTRDNTQIGYISNSIIRIKTGQSGGNLSNRSFTFLITGK
ncbi:MAG: hypothetical protein JSS94_05545 [Bacteroidetes bacterium]|nr:hypothetical protein [Bacteroidota bacterium]